MKHVTSRPNDLQLAGPTQMNQGTLSFEYPLSSQRPNPKVQLTMPSKIFLLRRSLTFSRDVQSTMREMNPQQRSNSFDNQACESLKPGDLKCIAFMAYRLEEVKLYLLKVHLQLPRASMSRRCHQTSRSITRNLQQRNFNNGTNHCIKKWKP